MKITLCEAFASSTSAKVKVKVILADGTVYERVMKTTGKTWSVKGG